jgi:hypothetical protein
MQRFGIGNVQSNPFQWVRLAGVSFSASWFQLGRSKPSPQGKVEQCYRLTVRYVSSAYRMHGLTGIPDAGVGLLPTSELFILVVAIPTLAHLCAVVLRCDPLCFRNGLNCCSVERHGIRNPRKEPQHRGLVGNMTEAAYPLAQLSSRLGPFLIMVAGAAVFGMTGSIATCSTPISIFRKSPWCLSVQAPTRSSDSRTPSGFQTAKATHSAFCIPGHTLT